MKNRFLSALLVILSSSTLSGSNNEIKTADGVRQAFEKLADIRSQINIAENEFQIFLKTSTQIRNDYIKKREEEYPDIYQLIQNSEDIEASANTHLERRLYKARKPLRLLLIQEGEIAQPLCEGLLSSIYSSVAIQEALRTGVEGLKINHSFDLLTYCGRISYPELEWRRELSSYVLH